MATQHKKAGRSIEITSALPADQLASICKEAAESCRGPAKLREPTTIRLEAATAGRLAFGVRRSTHQFLTFEVRLTSSEGRQVMTSRIRQYKTQQQKTLGLVPAGPKKMLGLARYEDFMQRFGELTRQADPTATVVVTG